MGIMENKKETTMVYWGDIGDYWCRTELGACGVSILIDNQLCRAR